MAQKIKVGAVSYLNTKPLIYGFEQGRMHDEVELVIDYPSNIASLLLSNRIDIGLVPVAVIPSMNEYHIVSDYCIGCDGEVASVCLFSDVPLEQIETIILDYQSRTSVALLKILLEAHWKISPNLVPTTHSFEHEIRGTTAGLVIGDRALTQRRYSAYVYDLGEAWKDMTGLPFVFAAWVSNKELPPAFIDQFSETNRFGLQNLDIVISRHQNPEYDMKKYFTENIIFQLRPEMMAGMNLFLEKLNRDL